MPFCAPRTNGQNREDAKMHISDGKANDQAVEAIHDSSVSVLDGRESSFVRKPFCKVAEERLWVTMKEKICADDLSFARVVIVGFEQMDRAFLLDALRDIGVKSVATIADTNLLDRCAHRGSEITHAVVNIAGFRRIREAVDALISFRIAAPDLCVVLVSHSASSDDFGIERSPIGDVTLRAPLSTFRLMRGLLEAGRTLAEARIRAHDARGTMRSLGEAS